MNLNRGYTKPTCFSPELSKRQISLELSERILSVSLNDPFSASKLEKLSGDEARGEKRENSCKHLKSWHLSMI